VLLWEDIRLVFRHFADNGRLAWVGEKRWQHGVASQCRWNYLTRSGAPGAQVSLFGNLYHA